MNVTSPSAPATPSSISRAASRAACFLVSWRVLSRATGMWATLSTTPTLWEELLPQRGRRQGHTLLIRLRTEDYPTPVVPCPFCGKPALDGRRQGLQRV